MNRRDGGFVLALVVVLVVLAGVVAAPSFAPAATPSPSPTPTPAVGHVQGVLGRPSSITPLTARTQVDRDLVALLFRGLVRLGPGSSVLPDLATRWSVDEDGARWTFHLRHDAWWHDGTPVTSADVVYTVGVLQDPDYAGPLEATWAQVGVTALDAYTVQFDLGDPVGGFLQAAALPLMPAHLLERVPVAALADDAFAQPAHRQRRVRARRADRGRGGPGAGAVTGRGSDRPARGPGGRRDRGPARPASRASSCASTTRRMPLSRHSAPVRWTRPATCRRQPP